MLVEVLVELKPSSGFTVGGCCSKRKAVTCPKKTVVKNSHSHFKLWPGRWRTGWEDRSKCAVWFSREKRYLPYVIGGM